MRKNILVLLFGIILIAGCTAVTTQDKITYISNQIEKCKYLKTGELWNEFNVLECIQDLAEDYEDISICESLGEFIKEEFSSSEYCINPKGSECKTVDPPGPGGILYSKEGCQNEVYYKIAISRQDPSYCEKIDASVLRTGFSIMTGPGSNFEFTKSLCFSRLNTS